MKTVLNLLPLAALASAIVVPDQAVFAQLPLENGESRHQDHDIWKKLPSLGDVSDRLGESLKHIAHSVPQTLDEAFAKIKTNDVDTDIRSPFVSWIEDSLKRLESPEDIDSPEHEHSDKYKLPNWLPNWPGQKHHNDDDHKHRRPHHEHHNLTIYQLISKSKYTTNLTSLIDEDKELVKLLNSTTTNHTIFAPTDYAFSKLPKHGDHKPSKEIIKKVLLYHILPDLYPAVKLLFAHTAPTLLESPSLGGHPQRVLVKFLGLLRGVRVNYYAPVVAPNIVSGCIIMIISILTRPIASIQRHHSWRFFYPTSATTRHCHHFSFAKHFQHF